ncbi:hypothetical protein ACROYT_G015013 [Oculina patagonica]
MGDSTEKTSEGESLKVSSASTDRETKEKEAVKKSNAPSKSSRQEADRPSEGYDETNLARECANCSCTVSMHTIADYESLPAAMATISLLAGDGDASNIVSHLKLLFHFASLLNHRPSSGPIWRISLLSSKEDSCRSHFKTLDYRTSFCIESVCVRSQKSVFVDRSGRSDDNIDDLSLKSDHEDALSGEDSDPDILIQPQGPPQSLQSGSEFLYKWPWPTKTTEL